ncbi:MAG TPA: hypothetical protein VMF65_02100, partial [Acidimicrobiales bacterium]|nr:hypothetical protein [Acidimicrobiales bacterium]
MDFSRDVAQLIRELSVWDIGDGLSEANQARKRRGTITNRWLGLPEPLREKMLRRSAAGIGSLDLDAGGGRGGVIAALGGVVGLVCGGTAVTEAITGGSSLAVGAMSTLALGALAVAAGSHWGASRNAARRRLELTMMERAV